MKLKRYSFFLCVCFLITIFYSEHAFAQTALFDSGTNFLTALQNLLTTTWARLIGIIAVALCGIAFMTGRMSWQVAGSVAIGIILIFGAPAIVDSVSGSL
jgi:type IV secretion system protein VirB2